MIGAVDALLSIFNEHDVRWIGGDELDAVDDLHAGMAPRKRVRGNGRAFNGREDEGPRQR